MKKKKKNLLDNPSLMAQWLLVNTPRHCWDTSMVMPSDLIYKGGKIKPLYVSQRPASNNLLDDIKALRRLIDG